MIDPFSRCQEASALSKGVLDDLCPKDDLRTWEQNIALFISRFLGSSSQMSYFPLVICEQSLNLFHATQLSKDTCRWRKQELTKYITITLFHPWMQNVRKWLLMNRKMIHPNNNKMDINAELCAPVTDRTSSRFCNQWLLKMANWITWYVIKAIKPN